MDDIDALKQRVARACRVLANMGMAKDTTGHVSARIPGSPNFLVRGRGTGELGVKFTTTDQVIEVDSSGRPVQPDRKDLSAPQEVFIHSSIYRARPDVYGVVHMHPRSVVLLSACRKPILPIYGAWNPASAHLAISGIPEFERSTLVCTPAEGDDLAAVLGEKRCCIMRGHGITTAGASVEEAAMTAIQLNDLAAMNLEAYQLGTPVTIPHDEQSAMSEIATASRASGKGTPPTGQAGALWAYFVALHDT